MTDANLPYSRLLADFVAGIRNDDLDVDTIEKTKQCVLDFLGVAMAGALTPQAEIWLDLFNSLPGANEASAWMPGLPRFAYRDAAAFNAACGHMLDYDDLHNTSIVHPAVITIPTALALGQKLGSSGKDVIAAIVAGFEVACRVGEAINPSSYWYWHTTSVVGSLSAANVAGHLMGFDGEQMNQCLGSAGTQAGGLWEFLTDGAMSKTLHTARANLNGIMAAELTKRGFTAANRILEGDKGFVKALAPEPHFDLLTLDLGEPYKVMTNSFKFYACCRHTHAGNYAVTQLMDAHGIAFDDIAAINDETYQQAIDICDNDNPQTPYGHKFSLQYCLAAVARHGLLSPAEFEADITVDPTVRDLMGNVTIGVGDDINAAFLADPNRWAHRVTITTKDGRVVTETIDFPKGDFQNPCHGTNSRPSTTRWSTPPNCWRSSRSSVRSRPSPTSTSCSPDQTRIVPSRSARTCQLSASSSSCG